MSYYLRLKARVGGRVARRLQKAVMECIPPSTEDLAAWRSAPDPRLFFILYPAIVTALLWLTTFAIVFLANLYVPAVIAVVTTAIATSVAAVLTASYWLNSALYYRERCIELRSMVERELAFVDDWFPSREIKDAIDCDECTRAYVGALDARALTIAEAELLIERWQSRKGV